MEKNRLLKIGRRDLAKKVERVSDKLGDGVGYDVSSFETDGSPRYIEVKTTKYGKELPFYISANELQFLKDHIATSYLYRVFSFSCSPKFFILSGSLEEQCNLTPQVFQVGF